MIEEPDTPGYRLWPGTLDPARGDMENRIKECQLDLYADRTSASTIRANQLRLWFASFAYVLSAPCDRSGWRYFPSVKHLRALLPGAGRSDCGRSKLARFRRGPSERLDR
jgi:hypothetical protein